MGSESSKEAQLKAKIDSINVKYPVSLNFPGFWDDEAAFWEQQKLVVQIMSCVLAATKMFVKKDPGLSFALTMTMKLFNTAIGSIKKAVLMLKIKELIAKNAHSFVEAKMEVVKKELESAQNETDMRSKENKLYAASNICYELLILFNKEDFYLLKYPLVFAPFFVSFVSIYLVVLMAHYLISKSSERRPDATKVLELLKTVIKRYQRETAEARKKCVKSERRITGKYHSDRIYIKDDFTKQDLYSTYTFSFSNDFYEEILEWYRKKVGDIYSSYFNESLEKVDDVLKSL